MVFTFAAQQLQAVESQFVHVRRAKGKDSFLTGFKSGTAGTQLVRDAVNNGKTEKCFHAHFKEVGGN